MEWPWQGAKPFWITRITQSQRRSNSNAPGAYLHPTPLGLYVRVISATRKKSAPWGVCRCRCTFRNGAAAFQLGGRDPLAQDFRKSCVRLAETKDPAPCNTWAAAVYCGALTPAAFRAVVRSCKPPSSSAFLSCPRIASGFFFRCSFARCRALSECSLESATARKFNRFSSWASFSVLCS